MKASGTIQPLKQKYPSLRTNRLLLLDYNLEHLEHLDHEDRVSLPAIPTNAGFLVQCNIVQQLGSSLTSSRATRLSTILIGIVFRGKGSRIRFLQPVIRPLS